ncbi:MAG: hypothetical protein AAGB46_19520 [Verrucomicrobiota bacterium]
MNNSTCIKQILGALALSLLMVKTGAPSAFGEADFKESEGIRITITQSPVFPYDMLKAGVAGARVTLFISVDEYGHLVDWMAIDATDESFVDAIGDVIYDWDFSPAYQGDAPIFASQRFPVYFDGEGAVLAIKQRRQELAYAYRYSYASYEESPSRRLRPVVLATIDQLDEYPEFLQGGRITVPTELNEASRGSSVKFEFYVDTDGWVRIPFLRSVEGEAHPDAIAFVQEALRDWKFKPLKVNGQAATIRMAQRIRFE